MSRDVPIILAGMSAGATSAKFAAEVSNHGDAEEIAKARPEHNSLRNRRESSPEISRSLDPDDFRATPRRDQQSRLPVGSFRCHVLRNAARSVTDMGHEYAFGRSRLSG